MIELKKGGVCVAALFAMAGVTGAQAQDGTYPRLEVEVGIEVQNDTTYESDDPAAELSDTYTTIEPAFSLKFNEVFSLEAGLTFEPVIGATDDRMFEDHGLYVSDLFFSYAGDPIGFWIGKSGVPFGQAWDAAPGVYGSGFAEDYELGEKIGLGASFTFGSDSVGSHTLTANTFFADTTALSDSIFQDRGRTRKSDGGVSNTEDLSSYSITLDGEEVPFLAGFGYTLGYSHQAKGVTETKDEDAFVIGVFGSIPLSENVSFDPIVEYAHVSNAGGALEDKNYLTIGGAIVTGPWAFSASYTGRETNPDVGADTNDELYALSVGYAFENGFGIDVGYQFAEESNIDSNTIGVVFSYALGHTF